jgi:hypothetical protein
MSSEDLQQEIEQTRQRLGETVDELAAKADVKARARATAAEAKERAQATAAEAKERAQATAAEAATRVQATAAGAAGRVQATAAGMSGRVRQNELVQRRWPVALAAGVLIVASVAIWRRRRKG